MTTSSAVRATHSPPIRLQSTGFLLMAGGAFAVIGNLLHPRFRGEDVDVYSRIASSTRFEVADVIILVSLLLVALGFVGLADEAGQRWQGQLGRLATVVGATVALTQMAVELFGLRQQARTFAHAAQGDQVGAFWSTVSVDKLNSALFALWVMVLLGFAPIALAYSAFSARTVSRSLGLVGMAGGACCVCIGMFDLLTSDQSSADVPFVVGSLLVTGWILVSGFTRSLQRVSLRETDTMAGSHHV